MFFQINGFLENPVTNGALYLLVVMYFFDMLLVGLALIENCVTQSTSKLPLNMKITFVLSSRPLRQK